MNLTRQTEQQNGRRWLTLGVARSLLGINDATLRQWADNGLVRAFRTPGGHRRFSAEDIHALTDANRGRRGEAAHVGEDARVLPRVRSRLRRGARHAPPWMALFDEDGHARMRELGRQFLELCTEHIDHPDRARALRSATRLGAAYGEELARRGIALGDAVQAFAFFRGATLRAITPALLKGGAGAGSVTAALEHFTRLTDQVLLGISACYQQAPDVTVGVKHLPQANASPSLRKDNALGASPRLRKDNGTEDWDGIRTGKVE